MNDSNEFEELINKEELERMDSISELIHRINEL
jgi:hypothetical protein